MREYRKNQAFEKAGAFFREYRGRIVCLGLFGFLFHGAKLNSPVIGIDTEDIIKLQGDFYGGWLTTGRQGLVLLKGLLGMLDFNPYFAGLLTLVFLSAAAFAFFWLWDKTAGGPGSFAGWFLGGLLWISHPIMTEQFYFSLQSAEICAGFLLTAFALFLTAQGVKRRHFLFFLGSGLLLLLVFSLYQVFVVGYIFGTLSLLLLQGTSGENGGEGETAGLIRQLLAHAGVFLAAFFINQLITRLFFGASDYLQGQILWGKRDFVDNLKGVLGHVVKACTGYDSIYYTIGYGLLCLLTLLLFGAVSLNGGADSAKGRSTKGKKLLLWFFLAALFLTPFLMTIVCGGAPAVRSQLVLPVMTGFLGYFDVHLWRLWRTRLESKNPQREKMPGACLTLALCMGAVCIVTGWMQLQVTSRLYYTDRMRYEQDAAMGRELITRLEQVRGQDSLPVIVIGKKEFEGNNACLVGEVIGRSFFDYDTDVEPAFYWSTRRILGFLHILGKDYAMVSEDRVEQAMEYSTYMPEWPAENSVQVWDGMIVVKLSHFVAE